MFKKKPTILYCDDKEKWLNLFESNHKEQYNIISTKDASKLNDMLKEMIKSKNPPDIILIDLFHPKFNTSPSTQEINNKIGQEAIDKLEAMKKEVRTPIKNAWDDLGYKMLKHARMILKEAHHENIPIAIYTEQGLTIATNEELETVANLDGQWLIKGSTPVYESLRLQELLNECRRKKSYTKTYTMLSVIGFVLLMITAWYSYFSHRIPDLIISTFSSAIIAIIPFLASIINRRK